MCHDSLNAFRSVVQCHLRTEGLLGRPLENGTPLSSTLVSLEHFSCSDTPDALLTYFVYRPSLPRPAPLERGFHVSRDIWCSDHCISSARDPAAHLERSGSSETACPRLLCA